MKENGMIVLRIPQSDDRYKDFKRDLKILADDNDRTVSKFITWFLLKLVKKKKAKMIKKGTWPHKEDYPENYSEKMHAVRGKGDSG